MAQSKKAQAAQGPHGGSVWTRYRQKKKGIGGKDGGGKQMKRRSTYATVASPHGPPAKAGLSIREIRCPIPRTRREKYLLGPPK
jgi:hypothetical protein